MNKLGGLMALSLFAFGGTLLSVSTGAYAHERDVGFRYKTTYHEFDRAFYQTYSYRETRCGANSWGTYTCYERERFASTSSYVWVEEKWYRDGYKRVTVYHQDPAYYSGNPYATYYVYDGYGNRRVERREWYCTYGCGYYDDWYYRDHCDVWVTLDWNDGWTNLIVGAYTTAIGVDVLANAENSTEALIGAASIGAGLSSSASGVDKLNKQSDLQKQITANEKEKQKGGNNIQ